MERHPTCFPIPNSTFLIVLKRLHFLVTGRVQGVGFRYYCMEAAARLRLVGYARNMPDGSVEVEVEGDDRALEEFAETVARGPRAGKVDGVVREERPTKGGRKFEVG